MDYTLALCISLLYAPHIVLCGLALLWQPILLVISLLASFVAFLPLVITGLVFQALRWTGTADVSTAAGVVVTHFVLQNVARVGALNLCLRAQRLGWHHGCLLVRSRFPLVPLSIAIGAGFAATSLLASGGVLLAEAWGVGRGLSEGGHTASTSTAAAQELDFLASSGSCARLPRLVQSCFQQTFFSCGQVAWTVMMGQAYAALWPRDVAVGLSGHTTCANGADEPATLRVEIAAETEEHGSAPTPWALRAEETLRQDFAGLLMADEEYAPVVTDHMPETAAYSWSSGHASSTARPKPREEAEVNQYLPCSTVGSESGDAGAVVDTAPSATPPMREATRSSTVRKHQNTPSSPSPLAGVAGWLVADSVLAQRLPTAVLTGTAALVLHLVFVLPPLTAMAADSASARNTLIPSSDKRSNSCLVGVSLQCIVTIVSLVWGLWIIELERHPSTYMLLSSSTHP
ncbi:hypothetical protein Q4I28_001758 [Leishmania naiffi]|uniref:Integral membrane protein n=1 Tax=Leishmania naiffi TaxID=5678 RepID=A0AAW3C3R0_9TRYP